MIAVVGVGGIGGGCAGQLLAAGADVVCCVRRSFRDLVVETPDGVLEAKPRVLASPAEAGQGEAPADWVLFATKAHQTEAAAGWLEAWMDADTRVAVLQNGVEHVERLAPWVEPERLVPVVVAFSATATAPGRILQRGPALLTVPAGANGGDFAALFAGTAVRVDVAEDWDRVAWKKLCLNVTTGPLAALAGAPLPEIRHPARGEIARALALECVRVARAEGVDLDDDVALGIAEYAANARRGGHPSTLTDRRSGRPLEADARNGAVVRIGARHGIPTPVNARALALLREVHREPEGDWLPRLAEALGETGRRT